MKSLITRLAGLASGLLVASATLSVWAAREVTVSSSWTTDAIQEAIAAYDVVKFAPGVYLLGYTETPRYHRNSLVITKSVKLMAADARSKPCLYVKEGTEVRPFLVIAPLGAEVLMQDLKISGPWNVHVLTCGTFEISGCEPAPDDSAQGLVGKGFGMWMGPLWTPSGELMPCQVGHFKAKGNTFLGNPFYNGYPFNIEPGKWSNESLKAEIVLEKNTFIGFQPASILQYGTLKMQDNDFKCTGYEYDVFASGFLVGCDDPESSAMLIHNRVFLDMPTPQAFDVGEIQPFVQIIMPFSVGYFVFGVGAHNVQVNQTTICSAPADFALPYIAEAWQASNCSIKNTSYGGVSVLPAGSQYDFFSETLAASWWGNAPLSIGPQDAAEYMILYSSDFSLIDNWNPQARVFEYPTPGSVRLLGRLQGTQE